MTSAPIAAGTTGGTSAKRTATGIAEQRRGGEREENRVHLPHPACRDEPPEGCGRGRLGEEDPGEHHGATGPARPPRCSERSSTPSAANGASSVNTSAARARSSATAPRWPRGTRARLRRPRDDQRVPGRASGGPRPGPPRRRTPRTRRTRRSSGGTSAPEGRSAVRTAPSRRSGATARRRSRGRACSRATTLQGPRSGAGARPRRARPRPRRGPARASGTPRARGRREDDVEPGDEAGARDGRQLEARGLQPVRSREQRPRTEPRQPTCRGSSRRDPRRMGPARRSRSRTGERGTRRAGRPPGPPAPGRTCSPRLP